ncbi:glycosyltransferase family 2 protein [bacterium]|nr:glycosyltransferase family 2 protein [bacterium]
MKKPEISVIVPVYNVEKYLKQCLDSILNQTFSNIEIICVNDGTKDSSRKILEEYRKKDFRIKIVDKKNGGLSSARNAGLKVAQGEFISFIDSDDWVEHNMLEKLYNSITTLDTDITICAVHQIDEQTQKVDDSNPYYTLGYFDETFDNKVFSYKDVRPFVMDVCVMAWNKLYRRSLIDSCNAEFPDGKIFEDGPFFFSLFFKTERVSIVRDFLYFYRINRAGSIVQKAGKKFLDIIDVAELMFDKVKELENEPLIQENFCKKKVEDFISRFENLDSKYKRQFAQKLKRHSSLIDEKYYTPDMLKGGFLYNYILFQGLKTGSLWKYRQIKYRMKIMYKFMEILYKEEGVYFFKYKKYIRRFKKRPNIFDIYYYNDRIYVSILKKIKFNFNFNFSELEKFHEDD